MRKKAMTILAVFLVLAAGLCVGAFLFLRQAKFGKLPSGERLARIERSPHYRDGKFHNLVPRPDLTEGVSPTGLYWDFFFRKKERMEPSRPIPSVKTDLPGLAEGTDALVWLGHSSYFLRAGGKTFLVDPHLSANASPFFFTTRAFAGTRPYMAADLPFADHVLITHDHWDHLDYETILAIKENAGLFLCGLGIGEHLAAWGVPETRIVETDWNDTLDLAPGIRVHTLTAHHFSGRTLTRDRALWVSFLLETPDLRIYFGGDSGYGPHFTDIGERFGPVDLAVLENGQYDANWKYSHMQPEEVRQAARDLKARAVFPGHSAKFVIANHPWDEPLRRITALYKNEPVRLLTPRIGEKVELKDTGQTFGRWWEGID